MKKSYNIDVECANCANKMEAAIAKLEGVKSVIINFLTQRITVEFGEGCSPETVLAEIERVCRKIEPDCVIEY